MHQFIRASVIALGAAMLACLAGSTGAQPARSSGTGSVAGRVTSEGEVPLSEMVVYLESPDPARPIPKSNAVMRVSQKGAKFSPPLLIISVGQTVEFLNDEEGSIEHNVFSNAATKLFDLGMYPPGQSRSVTFDKPGPVQLYCSIHRYMHGAIFVSPTPYTSRVDEQGNFRIDGVPAGTWEIKTWQLRRRFKEVAQPVEIEANKTAGANLELRRR